MSLQGDIFQQLCTIAILLEQITSNLYLIHKDLEQANKIRGYRVKSYGATDP